MKKFTSAKDIHDSYMQVASNVVEYFRDETRIGLLSSLRGDLEKHCVQAEKMTNVSQITESVLTNIAPQGDEDAVTRWESNVCIVDPDPSRNEFLKSYDNQVAAIIKAAENAEGSHNIDEDLEVEQSQNITTVCPISKGRMSEPMKNTICGHVYDKISINALLYNAEGVLNRIKCPMVGCKNNHHIKPEHLQFDHVSKMHLEKTSQ